MASCPLQMFNPRRPWFKRYAVVAFLVLTWGFMALLLVEQGRTISSQRNLIKQLFGDSVELNTMKMRLAQEHKPAPPVEDAQPKADDKRKQQREDPAPKRRSRVPEDTNNIPARARLAI
jgi:hypothetical protein